MGVSENKGVPLIYKSSLKGSKGIYKGFRVWEFPKIGGTFFGGPCNKDPTIQAARLGSPILGNPQIALATIDRKSEPFWTW